ncbi:hypothetical protein K439DRAFT_1351744 [Ramaria rubella]|nr:hypothetical protein K439DRAFT_1351744 [Ramaria rubella]
MFSYWLFNIVINEAQCVNEWGGTFRPEYSKLGDLHWMVPAGTPFAVAMGTLTLQGLKDLQLSLNLHPEKMEVIQLSND